MELGGIYKSQAIPTSGFIIIGKGVVADSKSALNRILNFYVAFTTIKH